jgi:hypothetical protein
VTETLERPRERPAPSQLPLPAVQRARRLSVLAALGVAAALAGTIVLALRILEDVHGKPLFEDEAVAGLIAARPFPEVLYTVWWERGGAPLHFVLSHLALWPDGSPYALRWLSVVFAFATVPLAWDLGRRLAGHVAGGVAALVVSASSILWVYSSFGRMYSLYVFAAALAVDLFVRALEKRTARAALAAALAAWLVPAVHPYGAFLVAAEVVVALVVWWRRGHPWRPAVPVAIVGLALVPLLVADLRLAERFSVGLDGEASVAPPGHAWHQVWRAFAASAGGEGWTLAVAAVLAAVGLVVLVLRRRYSVAALVGVSAALPPVLLLLARTSSAPGLSPRHLAYLVPLFAALIGVAVARAVRGFGVPAALCALAAVGILLVLSPIGGIRDPRDWQNDVLGGGPPSEALGGAGNLAGPTVWLEQNVDPGAVLFPYSAVYLAALPVTREADALPYAQRETVLRALERVDPPVRELYVSVPIGRSGLDEPLLHRLLGPRFRAERFGPWLLIRGDGPYGNDRGLLLATYRALAAAREATVGSRTTELGWYYKTTLSVLCGSLRTFGEACPPRSIVWLASRP